MKLGEKVTWINGWSRRVTLDDGREVVVSVRRGSAARGMYGVRGWQWHATIVDMAGKEIDHFRCDKNLGVRGIIDWAGLGPKGPHPRRR